MTRASFRLFRTCLIGSVILALAAGGHLAGGGQLPHPVILTALCAVAMVPTAFLTRFRLSFPVLAGLLTAGQAWLHWSFGALSAARPVAVPEPAAHFHSGHAAARAGAGYVRRRHARYCRGHGRRHVRCACGGNPRHCPVAGPRGAGAGGPGLVVPAAGLHAGARRDRARFRSPGPAWPPEPSRWDVPAAAFLPGADLRSAFPPPKTIPPFTLRTGSGAAACFQAGQCAGRFPTRL